MGRLRALDPLLLDNFKDQIYYDKNIVKNIIDLINNNINPPYSIAVSGSWGSGKTMLLKLIQQELEQKQCYPTIWFNPWEYDNSGNVVLSLQKYMALEFRDRFKFTLKELGIFGLTLVTAGIDTIARFATKGSVTYANIKEIEDDVRDALGKTGYDKYEDEVIAIKKDFVALTRKVSEKNDGKPLVIFFDDLDRCLPENALKLLEALKNLFVIKEASVIVISAIDTGVAKSFIRKRYEGIGENFAINYFKKVFNLTLVLPSKPTGSLKKYLADYIERLFNKNNNKPEGGLEYDAPQAQNIADYLIQMSKVSGTISLRALLNTINNYFVIRKMAESVLNYKSVLPLLFLQEVWNEFYEQLKTEALKLDGKIIGEVLNAQYINKIYVKDEKLQNFWDSFIDTDIEVREVRKANLI